MKNKYINFEMHKFPLFHISTVGGSKKSFLLVILVILVLFPSLVILGGLLVQFLWNQSVANIFNLQDITLKQSIALLFLCKILFGFLERDWGNEESESEAESDKVKLPVEDECVEIKK